ncbi:hypothetical protein [Pedobacter zeae]|uniref:Uncharacterized protein n=1 Tax=Pedobacter zeae TaxID=1737356 RepID=A0A7W6KF76_9SPHI|nr:hypothetical protein [Pedobacter zeae]MBB4109580.1 hypothetical protein [Pedobacter zeae]GGH13044.1 hypothetical protein GCM10007422_33390 [Pedobacter zeae]
MNTIRPNYSDYGLSSPMSAELRKVVESQLIEDLRFYGIDDTDLKFDWSNSCIEGHDGEYLGSYFENYSGILVFDKNDNLLADGWMDFIDGPELVVYWDFIDTWKGNKRIAEKSEPGVPEHILDKINKI